jgi:hypothetical protein
MSDNKFPIWGAVLPLMGTFMIRCGISFKVGSIQKHKNIEQRSDVNMQQEINGGTLFGQYFDKSMKKDALLSNIAIGAGLGLHAANLSILKKYT